MKNAITLLFVLFTFITCSKKNDPGCISVTPQSESAQIAAFCDANGISYTVDANGIYYQIIDQGSGITPNATSTLDGNVVEDKSTSPVTEALSDFIEGWRIALPYIQKGGHIKMIIPSSLAYGCTGIPNLIAPNSPLYYDVVLIDVQ